MFKVEEIVKIDDEDSIYDGQVGKIIDIDFDSPYMYTVVFPKSYESGIFNSSSMVKYDDI